jgi:hypothetical protein
MTGLYSWQLDLRSALIAIALPDLEFVLGRNWRQPFLAFPEVKSVGFFCSEEFGAAAPQF